MRPSRNRFTFLRSSCSSPNPDAGARRYHWRLEKRVPIGPEAGWLPICPEGQTGNGPIAEAGARRYAGKGEQGEVCVACGIGRGMQIYPCVVFWACAYLSHPTPVTLHPTPREIQRQKHAAHMLQACGLGSLQVMILAGTPGKVGRARRAWPVPSGSMYIDPCFVLRGDVPICPEAAEAGVSFL